MPVDDTILRDVPFNILNNPVFMKKKYAALLDLISLRFKASMNSYVQNGGNRNGEYTITIRLMVYKICFTYGTSTGPARRRSQHQYRTSTRTYKRRLKGRRMVFSMKRLELQRKLEHQRKLKHRRKLEQQRKVYAYISAPTPSRAMGDSIKENAYSNNPPFAVDSIKDDAYKSAPTPPKTKRDILKEIAYSNNPPVDLLMEDAYLITPIPPVDILKEDEEDWNKEKEKGEKKGKKEEISSYKYIDITISNLSNLESFIDKFSSLTRVGHT